MTISKVFLPLTLLVLLSGCIVINTPLYADVHIQKELSLDAHNLDVFDIEAGAGSLIIQGKDNITEISVIADIYVESENQSNYELSLTQSGNKAYLVAKINNSFGSWMGSSPHINIIVNVPKQLMLEVNDGSGELSINNINGNIDLTDGSGAIEISQIVGNIELSDGSGAIEIDHVVGNTIINDGSGSLELVSVIGNVDLTDGSGSIYIADITGTASINDGSGELTVHKVSGHVTIEDGSGNIIVSDVGSLKIIEEGSGGLKVSKVAAGFEIDS